MNEILFYFGFIGLMFFIMVIYTMVRRVQAPLELTLIIYFVFNHMFRLELIILIPVLLFVVRQKYVNCNIKNSTFLVARPALLPLC